MAKRDKSGGVVSPVVLIWGEDAFMVRQRAKAVFAEWSAAPGMDAETIDGAAGNSGEALRALGRLREALQTLPFFGSGKLVWFQGCNFLGDERTATAEAVTSALAELAAEWAAFDWRGVQLLVSAGKVDKRRTFYKTLERIGRVEEQVALSAEQCGWEERAGELVRQRLLESGQQIDGEALARLVVAVGPNLAQLQNEADKVAIYAGAGRRIGLAEVQAVVSKNKQARAFALGDALGDRDVARLMRCLDEELWQMERSREKSEIGILYGLVGKVRAMLLAKELVAGGALRVEGDYQRFKAQVERLPAEKFPADRRFSPLGLNPYVLYRAAQQSRNYTTSELVEAMDLLLRCNLELVASGRDASLSLQQALLRICGEP